MFSRDKRAKDGCRSQCKGCDKKDRAGKSAARWLAIKSDPFARTAENERHRELRKRCAAEGRPIKSGKSASYDQIKRDPEKLAAFIARVKRWGKKHKSKLAAYQLKVNANQRRDLKDVYIRKILSQATGMRACEIPEALVAAKRAHLKLKREIKEQMK